MKVPRFGHFVQQGAEVQKFAIKRAGETFDALAADFVQQGGARESLTFIGHQANLRMLEAVMRRCEIAPSRHFFNVDRRGNTGAAGAPSVLSEKWGDPALGGAIALCVVGSGLTWAGALLIKR